MNKKLAKELKELDDDEIIVIVVNAKEYLGTNLDILKYLVEKEGHECVYITLNRPYENLVKLFKKNKINPEKFFFIDAISQTIGVHSGTSGAEDSAELRHKKESGGVIFISSPHGLTEISIAIAKAMSSLESKKKFVFFDSISTLSIYNQAGTVTKFAHFLVGRTRAMQLKGVLISLEKETEEHLINQMSQFVDKVIYLGGKK